MQVGSILLTGSAQTYEAIVWGADKSKVCTLTCLCPPYTGCLPALPHCSPSSTVSIVTCGWEAYRECAESAAMCHPQTKRAVDKPVDGELGCVTPYIICPGGNWTDADIEFQAGQVQRRSTNCSAWCCSPALGGCTA